MADTGENHQIIARVNAKEAETVRSSKKMIREERSSTKAMDAAFGGKVFRQHEGSNKEPGPYPKSSQT